MSEEEIMSEEAFNELIDNLEIIEKLTPYGRKAIKYWVNKLQKENKVLKTTINKQSADISNNLLELQQKDKQIDLILKEQIEDGYLVNFHNLEEAREYYKRIAKEKGE